MSIEYRSRFQVDGLTFPLHANDFSYKVSPPHLIITTFSRSAFFQFSFILLPLRSASLSQSEINLYWNVYRYLINKNARQKKICFQTKRRARRRKRETQIIIIKRGIYDEPSLKADEKKNWVEGKTQFHNQSHKFSFSFSPLLARLCFRLGCGLTVRASHSLHKPRRRKSFSRCEQGDTDDRAEDPINCAICLCHNNGNKFPDRAHIILVFDFNRRAGDLVISSRQP